MLNIESNGAIHLTRGDTARFVVNVTDKETGEPYEVQPNDRVAFTVKKSTGESDALVSKEVTGSNLIWFKPSDTAELPYGKYKYDVQITLGNGDVYTVIPPSVFEVAQEVTW